MSQKTEFLFLERERIPCWFEISFDPKEIAIVVKVHEDFLEFLPEVGSYFIEGYMEKFKFDSFIGDLKNGDFGFHSSFKRIGKDGSFIVFLVKVPVFESNLMQDCDRCQGNKKTLFEDPCSNCRGTGKILQTEECWCCNDGEHNSNCFRCNGTGKVSKTELHWREFHAISASFSIFFDLMFFGQDADKIVASKNPQLIIIQTATDIGQHGGTLDGTYSIDLVDWLASLSQNTKITEVVEAMEITHRKIYGKFDDMDKMNTTAWVRDNGCLSIGCSGDRTGLHSSSFGSIGIGRGYQFSCHNVDTSMQQLTLLVGLATLCDKVRKEMVY